MIGFNFKVKYSLYIHRFGNISLEFDQFEKVFFRFTLLVHKEFVLELRFLRLKIF